MIELSFAIHNGLEVPPKNYEAPPSHIPTLSQGGGDSG
jgi:hypothetical protein